MNLLPLVAAGDAGPGPSPITMRGIAISWQEPALPLSGPPKKFAPKIAIPTWFRRIIPFTALTRDRADRPPNTTTESERMTEHAAAIVAAHAPDRIGNVMFYEIGTWTPVFGTASLLGRVSGRCTGVAS